MSTISLSHETYLSGADRAGVPVLQSVSAEGTVNGLLFELAVKQRYVNAGSTNIEAVYTFPVPWNAVLLGVELVLGDKVLQGAVVAKEEGARRYEQALEQGDSAVMVERAGDGMYTVSVGNLLPGEEATVCFRYAQLLSFAQGQVRLVVPTVIAPRYGNPVAVGLQPHQVPSTDLFAEYPFALTITVHGAMASATLHSPSHRMAMRHHDGNVTIALGSDAQLDRDFVLKLEGLAGKSVSTLGRDGDGYVALASFCPAPASAPPTAPLHFKILVDCSGSMNGERIDAARRALHEVLGYLRAADRFSLSCFGSEVQHMCSALIDATPDALGRAGSWVSALRADMGGTEIGQALQSTFALTQSVAADILLITDGDVWETQALVASAEAAEQRIFAVGIGSAPGSNLLHALTARTGGASEYVTTHTEVQGAVMRMFRRMRQAPVRDVTMCWDGAPAWQTKPSRTVLAGETVHQFAGFSDRAPVEATLGWCDTAGNTAQREMLAIDDQISAGDTLARVAAAARMEETDRATRHALALQYGLVGATTSLVLVHQREDAIHPAGLPELRTVSHALPAGWGGVGRAAAAPLGQPAVWRREAPSATFRVAQEVETYDIPVFLRKMRPASTATTYQYRDALRRFAQTHAVADATFDREKKTITSLDELAADLPGEIIDELRQLVRAGFAETAVIHALFTVLVRRFGSKGIARRLLGILRRPDTAASGTPEASLEALVDALVTRFDNARTAATHWHD